MRSVVCRATCLMLSVVLVATQTAGCAHTATANPGAGTRVPNVTNSDLQTRQPDPESNIRLAGNEVLLFGRLEVTRTGAAPVTDLWYDSALYLTAEDAPTQPIPRWPVKSLTRASVPFNPSKDGRFELVAPAGTYRLQVFYRDAGIGWLAIVPAVEIEATTPGSALYVGVLRIGVDPQAISRARQSKAAKPPLSVQVLNDYADDLAAMKSYQSGFESLTTGSAMMRSAEGVEATALLSTNAASQSQTKDYSVVKSILLGIVLVPLFAAAIVLSVFAGGNIQFGK
jgi:hypothetical protein